MNSEKFKKNLCGSSLILTLISLVTILSSFHVEQVFCNSTTHHNGFKPVWSSPSPIYTHRINKKDSTVGQDRESIGEEYGTPGINYGVGDINPYINPLHYSSGSNSFGNTAAYHYQWYPDQTHNSFGNYPNYHQYQSSNGWNSNQRPKDGGFNFKGLEDLNLNLDSIFSSSGPLVAVFGAGGVKVVLTLVKLSIVLLSLFPLFHLIVVVPVTAIVVILILLIPLPVYNNNANFPGMKSLRDSTELLARQVFSSNECVERMTCQLSKVVHEYGHGNLIQRIKKELVNKSRVSSSNSKSTSHLTLREKISRGFSSEESGGTFSCEKFTCDPLKSVKKAFKF